jgi:hypothetical protein
MAEQQFWLVSLPLEGRLSRGAAGAEQVLKVLNDKTAPDLSTNYKARAPGGRAAALRRKPYVSRAARSRALPAASSPCPSCAWAPWTRCWR